MTSPAYHLRPNKAADRFALIEAIRRLERLGEGSLNEYVYHGLGGPYLEDFRLLYEFYPNIGMVSIEEDGNVFQRQQFHLPCSNLELEQGDVSSFIARYDPGETKSIFWLDYTRLDFSCFSDLQSLLYVVLEGSMLKITLRCNPQDYWVFRRQQPVSLKEDRAAEFQATFEQVLPDQAANPPSSPAGLALLVQNMLRIATQQILQPAMSDYTFIPVSSFYYSDGTWMFTLTGIVWESPRKEVVEQAFGDWEFANLTWDNPRQIAVPVLSTKERLYLQGLLPSKEATGKTLRESLGHLISDDIEQTEGGTFRKCVNR